MSTGMLVEYGYIEQAVPVHSVAFWAGACVVFDHRSKDVYSSKPGTDQWLINITAS